MKKRMYDEHPLLHIGTMVLSLTPKEQPARVAEPLVLVFSCSQMFIQIHCQENNNNNN